VTRRAWLELLIVSALWGAVYPLIEVALRDFSPTVIVFGRVALAALMLTPLAVRRDALRLLWCKPRTIIETVLVQSTIPLLLLTFGQRYVSAGVAGILVGAQPLFVGLISVRYAPDQRPQGWRGLVGVLVGFLGLVLLFSNDLTGSTAIAGGLLVLGAAVCYAAGAVMIFRRHADAQPLGVATSAMLVTSVAVFAPASLTLPTHAPSGGATAALVVLGIACTGATLVVFYNLIATAGPAKAALAFYLSPAFAIAFSALFLQQIPNTTVVIGLIAIVVGSVLAAHTEQ
jgi:drug/metabolite transporter (DMT)-like permease